MTKIKEIKAKKDGSGKFLFLFIAVFAAVIGHAFLNQPAAINASGQAKPLDMNFSQVIKHIADKDISSITINKKRALVRLKNDTEYKATIVYDPALLEKISASGANVLIDDSETFIEKFGTWMPVLIGILLIWWIFRGVKNGGMPNMSRFNPTKITTGKTKTTFADIAGIDAEKQEVSEIVDFLKKPEKFKRLGARVPRGILMSGAPGTGKTLLARAIAGEANVPFFATSGSDFSGIIVGLGVAKIKEIFEMAKKNAPCILFIDEIDAIGQRRGHSSFNDNDREQTLNQLLIEMDGFSNESGIIVIGATNRPDMLDNALLRPGRFDRQVNIELPDLKGRREILELYAKKKKIAKGVNLEDIARGTTGFSGADLENLLNEAALHAVRADRKEIIAEDLEEARDKNLMGPKKTKKMRAEDIKLTAYHEAGHAFVSTHYRDIADPIHKATIIPRGRTLGMVQHLPIDNKVSMNLSEIRANLEIAMAGRAAEELFWGPDKITTGAEADIRQATRLARYSIVVAGMSKKIGLIAVNQAIPFGSRAPLENASEKTAEAVDAEVAAWLDTAKKNAAAILTRDKAMVKKLADELLARETLTREEIEKIVLGKKPRKK